MIKYRVLNSADIIFVVFRSLALEILLLICSKANAENDADILAQFLPGIVSQLTDLVTKITIGKLDTLGKAVEIIRHTITLCLRDSNSENQEFKNSTSTSNLRPEVAQLIVKRDGNWRMETETNLKEYLLLLAKRLIANHDHCVSVKASARNLFEALCRANSNQVDDILHDRLRHITDKLPIVVRQGNGDAIVSQLTVLLPCLSTEIRLLLDSRAPEIVDLFRILAQSLQFEKKKMAITKLDGEKLEESKISEFLTNLPLKFDLNHGILKKFCQEMGKLGFSEVLDLIYTEMQTTSSQNVQSAYLYLMILIADFQNGENQRCESELLMLELLLEKISTIEVNLHVKDDEIRDTSLCYDDTSILLALSLIGTALLAEKCRHHLERNIKLRVETLFYTLKHCVSKNWIVASAAQRALRELAKEMNIDQNLNSVTLLLDSHSPYIISKIALACRRKTDHIDAPLVFRAFMERSSHEFMPEETRHQCIQIVDSLLQSLDSFEQKHTLLIIQCLSTYISAVNRSTGYKGIQQVNFNLNLFCLQNSQEVQPSTSKERTEEIKDEERDENLEGDDVLMMETEKPSVPLIVQNIEGILKRTKHLLFSPYRPIQINALAACYACRISTISCCRWFIKTGYRLERILRTIRVMSVVSKTFIYRRVLFEWWPSIEEKLRKIADAPSRHLSDAYKFQAEVFKSLPVILVNIGVDDSEELAKFEPILEVFSEKSRNPQIRDLANDFRQRLYKLKENFSVD
ncbi:hypothetical protein WR25_03031 [Diploscapter pachys]|uniref:TTI1 N-terminal TPR domain-containing protein n=1 Tax=Diploscapter pachys TaxID=2018661 RepID=A0A2A2LTF6_9BILA|nr:hypothetical protein WR25_03031 [Diploscapter pachys]